jgi:hypothetical protein
MEEFLAKKRVSMYLVLICWAFAVSMQHPGFAMMVTGTILLFLLFVLRFIAHFEGQYMLKAAEAAHPGMRGRATATVYRHLAFEFGIALVMFLTLCLGLIIVVRHVPWLWFPTST